MTLGKVLALLVFSIGLVVAGRWQGKVLGSKPPTPNGNPGFRLSLSTTKNRVRLGGPVLLRLSTKNTTKRILFVTESSPETDYVFEVRDAEGKQLPLTEHGKQRLANRDVLRFVLVKLRPGEENINEIQLDTLVQMDRQGTYSILAKRKVPATPKSLETLVDIVSNPVTVVISDE